MSELVEDLELWLDEPAYVDTGKRGREIERASWLIQRARDEIVALREIAARPSSELHALTKERDELRETVERQRFVLSKGHAETRADALEEAAQFIEEQQRRQRIWLPFGDAIRALKEKADE